MQPKLILIEGLPGSGKSKTAELVYDYLEKLNIPSEVYFEGNLDHPADYDGVALFTEGEFQHLLSRFPEYKQLLIEGSHSKDHYNFIAYQKLVKESEDPFPEPLLNAFYEKDIYELPLNQHIQHITARWQDFAAQAKQSNNTYIFECCYIQNPVTTSFIKYNASKDIAMEYIQGLTDAVKDLNPLLIYVDQNDIGYTFHKALNERPKAWADFFIDYYTRQGYGKESGYVDIDGTIEVLKQRAKLEKNIIDHLDIDKALINNSQYDQVSYQKQVTKLLKEKYNL